MFDGCGIRTNTHMDARDEEHEENITGADRHLSSLIAEDILDGELAWSS